MPGTRYTVFNPGGESFVPEADRFAFDQQRAGMADRLARDALADRERDRLLQRELTGSFQDRSQAERGMQRERYGFEGGLEDRRQGGMTQRASMEQSGATERARIGNEVPQGRLAWEREHFDRTQGPMLDIRNQYLRGMALPEGGGGGGFVPSDDDRRAMLGSLFGYTPERTREQRMDEFAEQALIAQVMSGGLSPRQRTEALGRIRAGDLSADVIPQALTPYSARELEQQVRDGVRTFQERDLSWNPFRSDPGERERQALVELRDTLAQQLMQEKNLSEEAALKAANQIVRAQLAQGKENYETAWGADETRNLIQALGM
jgi:hypothetical protein